jgi:pimeloyl-ACP methyl ester carboxylesterase
VASAPASILLIHGAGSGPWIFDGWTESFPGLIVSAVDLHAGIDVDHGSMSDYAKVAAVATQNLPPPVTLCGWSMGGLVALQAAEALEAHSIVLLEPSAPAEVQGFRTDVGLEYGSFDPEVAYGPFPHGMRARPESRLARAERKRGITVPALPCPTLVIYGDDYREERGVAVARFYRSEERYFPGLDHWALVRESRVRAVIAEFLGAEFSALPGKLSSVTSRTR